MQQKIEWIDTLKAIGILAVILGHIASPLGEFIFSWHMPLFFTVAGFFIRYDLSFKIFILKDFKRLMIPYFIFTIFALLIETTKRFVLGREKLDYIQEFEGIFIWMDMTSLINSYAFVLWFLPALFFAKIFLYVINKYIQNIFKQFLIISLLFWISFYIQLPFGIDNALNAILFLFIGAIYFKYYQESKILYILPIILIVLYLSFGIPNLDVATKHYSNILINILFSISIIYLLIIILKKINYSKKLITLWGSNSMLLFIMHPYTNNIAHIIVNKFHFGDWYLKFFISLVLLQVILIIKQRFNNKGLFKYV